MAEESRGSRGQSYENVIFQDEDPFPANRMNVITTLQTLSSTLSIVSSFSVLCCFLFWKHTRKSTSYIVFFLSLSDFIGSLALIVGRAPANAKSHVMCVMQAMTAQTFLLSSALWTASISFNMLFLLSDVKADPRIKAAFYHLVNWMAPMLISSLLPFMKAKNQTEFVYGDATLWCWIRPKYSDLRMSFFYIPIWIIFSFNLVVYIIAWRTLRKNKREAASKKSRDERTAIRNIKEKQRARELQNEVMENASLYAIAFCIVWVPATLHRVHDWMHPDHRDFYLFALHAFFSPLHGFANGLIFWYRTVKKSHEAFGPKQKWISSEKSTKMTSSTLWQSPNRSFFSTSLRTPIGPTRPRDARSSKKPNLKIIIERSPVTGPPPILFTPQTAYPEAVLSAYYAPASAHSVTRDGTLLKNHTNNQMYPVFFSDGIPNGVLLSPVLQLHRTSPQYPKRAAVSNVIPSINLTMSPDVPRRPHLSPTNMFLSRPKAGEDANYFDNVNIC